MSCKKHFDEFGTISRTTRGLCTHDNKTCQSGTMCRPCFDSWCKRFDDLHAREAVCPDCIAENLKRAEYTQLHDTIDPTQPWGQHIDLTCVNHPELRWHTKNISFIGARSIFYAGAWGGTPECSCPASDLRVV